jgi:thioesterase domain-containing protein
VEREQGCRVPVFSEPATIEHLAALILRQEATPSASPPLFAIPAAGENPYGFHLLAGYLGADRPVRVLRNPEPVEQRGRYAVEDVAERLLPEVWAAGPPYMLLGDCYGGMVAFEIARQLEVMGEEVGWVALIDTPRPGYPSLARQWRLYLRTLLSLDWVRRSEHPVREFWRGAREFAGRFRRRGAEPTTANVRPSGPDADAANRAAAAIFRPRPYGGRVIQFVAADEWMTDLTLDSRLGWREVAASFEARKVAGRHESLLAEPSVRELAAQVAVLIDQAAAARREQAAGAAAGSR